MLREVAIGSVRRRNTFVPEQDVHTLLEEARGKNFEAYVSVFLFGTEFEEYLKSTHKHSVRGFTGEVFPPDMMIVDIDKGSNSGEATCDKFKRMLTLLLEGHKVDNIYVYPYFSGTGYHIGLPSSLFGFTPGPELPGVVKATLLKTCPECDVSYVTHQGLIRVSNTVNLKTLKYKIPLNIAEALSLSYEQALEEASLPRIWDHKIILSEPTLEHMLTSATETPKGLAPGHRPPKTEAQSNLVMCMQKLFAEGGVEGQRHKKLPALVSSWRLGGLSLEAIYTLAQAWAPTMDAQELREIVSYSWEKGYTFSCEHPVMAEYCDRHCAYFSKKDAGLNAQHATDLGERLRQRITTNWEGREFHLQDIFKGDYDFRVRTGDMIEVIGDVGLGKTAVVITLLSALRWKVLYFNLEMKSETVYRRFLQNRYDLSELEVYEQYMGRYAEFDKELDWLTLVNDPPDTSNLQKLIAAHQPKIVVFDTFDDLPTKGVFDPTGRTEAAAREIRRLTDKFDIVTICIHHVTKSAVVDGITGGRRRLNVHSGKGSSALEQKADIVLMLEGFEATSDRTLISGKTRDTNPLNLHLLYDKRVLKYREAFQPPPQPPPQVSYGVRLSLIQGEVGTHGDEGQGERGEPPAI